MINMVGVEYALLPLPTSPDIPAVVSTLPGRRYRRNKDRDRDEGKKKGNPLFEGLLFEKELQEEIGQIGCFFEAQA